MIPRPDRLIPVPSDFVEYGRRRSLRECAAHYRVSQETVQRWRKVLSIEVGRRTLWSADEDAYLRAHYGRSRTADIAAELNRSMQATQNRAKHIGLKRPKLINRPVANGRAMMERTPQVYGRVQGTADLAASHVRAHDRTPVYRCDATGKANPKGNFWKYGYGSLVLTETELLTKAERKGWSADSWKRLAA